MQFLVNESENLSMLLKGMHTNILPSFMEMWEEDIGTIASNDVEDMRARLIKAGNSILTYFGSTLIVKDVEFVEEGEGITLQWLVDDGKK